MSVQLTDALWAHLVPPRTELERRIAAVWRDVLKHDHISVAAELGDAFQIDLPVRAIFDAPMVEAVSREVVICLVCQRTGSALRPRKLENREDSQNAA